MSFPRYPKYKNSGVEWLGEVPEHWDICALSYRHEIALGKMLDEKRITGKHLAPYLRNTDVQWGRINIEDLPQMDFEGGDLVRYGLRKGDLLVCEGGDVGRAAIWDAPLDECYYQKALHRIRPADPNRDTPRFLCSVLRAANSLGVFSSSGGKSTIAHLTAEDLRRYRLPFPPIAEQMHIAEFLDRETGKIDELVAEQQRLMELLKEKRQAVISHAVTKGLNPRAPMKPSGIEWLGDVPEHWTIARLFYGATVENGTTPSRDKVEYWFGGSIPWLSSGEVNQYRINEATEFITDLALAECSLRLLPKGTIVVGMIGQGKTRGLAATLEIEAAINQNLAGLVPRPNLKSDYLLYIFQSVYEYLREYGRGGNQAALNCEILSALRVPMPPLVEQSEICTYLGARLSEFDALAAEAQKAIDLLQERRTALISAAVTGQIDVRKLAAA